MMFLSMLVSVIVLAIGAHFFIKSSVSIATLLKVPNLWIAMLVMSFATSIPEIWVVIQSAQLGNLDLAVGNIIGSYVANISFAIGLPAIIRPIVVQRQLTRKDLPIALLILSLIFLLLADGMLTNFDAILLFICLFVWMFYLFREVNSSQIVLDMQTPRATYLIASIQFFLGVVLLHVGSSWLIDSAMDISKHFAVSPILVGLTLVAIGTSLPEIAASLTAVMHGDCDIAVGTALGSNIFLLLFALPAAILLSKDGFPSSHIWHEYIFLVVITAAFWLFSAQFDRVLRINRIEGIFLVMMGLTFYLLQIRFY